MRTGITGKALLAGMLVIGPIACDQSTATKNNNESAIEAGSRMVEKMLLIDLNRFSGKVVSYEERRLMTLERTVVIAIPRSNIGEMLNAGKLHGMERRRKKPSSDEIAQGFTRIGKTKWSTADTRIGCYVYAAISDGETEEDTSIKVIIVEEKMGRTERGNRN